MINCLVTMCQKNVQKTGSIKESVMQDISEVMKKHTKQFMSLPGVVGVYIGENENQELCIKVMAVENKPELENKIPRELDGYPVEIEITGEIKPLAPQK